jgi:ribosomal protein L11 methyltransferase
MPGRWLVLTVRAPSEERMDEFTEGLFSLGGGAVEVEGDRLTTYIAEPPELETFLAAAAETLGEPGGGAPELVWRWQEDQDWSRTWREGLVPRRVGRRVVVAQPWNADEVRAQDGDVLVVIDPATAFGTGEHATTRGAIRLMEAVLTGGERVLDVGTGSGVLALAAAGLGAAEVLAVESDESSMSNAAENLERSPWGDRVALVNAEVDADYVARHRGDGFDLVVANVLSGVLVPLLPAFRSALAPGGAVILGGILESEAETVEATASDAGLLLDAVDREEGWWTARFLAATA